MNRLHRLARRFLLEERGQDLIEYALLTMIVTTGGVTIFSVIQGKMADLYDTWRTDFQNEAKWIPNPPS